MPSVKRVEYFKMMVPNRAGQGARALDVLHKAGINLIAFSGFPQGGGAQMDFIPEKPAAFRKIAKKAKWKIGRSKRAFLISGDTGPERLREARASGHHLLHKPVHPMMLRAMLNRLLKEDAADKAAT